MSRGELVRRWMTALCNVSALVIILLCTAGTPDVTELRAVACFIAWKVILEFAFWLVMLGSDEKSKRGRVRFAITPAAVALCLALSLAPRPRTTYVERQPGEPDASFLPRATREIARSNA